MEGQLERLTDELEWYKNEFKKRQADSLKNPVISSSSMKQVMDMVKHIANMNVIVLLLGETGVGKGYIASLIHNLSNRREYPFITVNCAAIPKELLESELFGYEEGAFTGAKKGGKRGLFEITGEGTIFLDEIGDMPLELQVKLLHVLDKRTITRVGGETKINIKARIVTAELISSFNNEAILVLEEIPENMTLKEVMDNYEKSQQRLSI